MLGQMHFDQEYDFKLRIWETISVQKGKSRLYFQKFIEEFVCNVFL